MRSKAENNMNVLLLFCFLHDRSERDAVSSQRVWIDFIADQSQSCRARLSSSVRDLLLRLTSSTRRSAI
jgi:hypothetical protein